MPLPQGMPTPPPGAAGMPPGMAPAPDKTAPATIPQGNQGNMGAAQSKVRNAIEMLQAALPEIPFGSEEHKLVIDFIAKVGKHVGDKGGTEGLDLQALLQHAKAKAESAPQKRMLAMMPPTAPNAPPAIAEGEAPTA